MGEAPTVLIIGCGIAGPVLALLLRERGYQPIVFEKVRQLGEAGASLMLMPNGMKVLNSLGLAEEIIAATWPLEHYQDMDSKGELLGNSNIPSEFIARYTQPGVGIKRTALNLMLKEALLAHGIDCREGWALEELTEENGGITAHFNKNRSVSGAIVVGCDGIKAVSRDILLKRHGLEEAAPIYTGLSQTAGISPLPASLKTLSSMSNWYGNGIHVIAYPINHDQISWAVTQREVEQSKESWRLYSEDEMTTVAQQLAHKMQNFDPAVLEMIGTAQRLTKYGLFDRPQLAPQHWHWSRCVLVGDAAHPTSPHLGQGGNQALEDCYHLSHAMPNLGNGEQFPANDALEQIFVTYSEKRQPRTSTLVKGARAVGDMRVLGGSTDDILKRNEILAAGWKDREGVYAKFDGLCREPF